MGAAEGDELTSILTFVPIASRSPGPGDACRAPAAMTEHD
jgi:hypothetical protein